MVLMCELVHEFITQLKNEKAAKNMNTVLAFEKQESHLLQIVNGNVQNIPW